MDAEEHEPDQKKSPVKWVFPGTVSGNQRPQEIESGDPTIVLCSLPAAEALAVCARLESEGIACESARRLEGDDGSSEQPLVNILIAIADRDVAEEILAGSGRIDDDDEIQFEQDNDKTNAANWICPKCRRRTLELLPAAYIWRWVRKVCLIVLIMPLVIALFDWVTAAPPARSMDDLDLFFLMGWGLAFVVLVCAFVLPEHRKRCTECDWRSHESNG